MITQKLEQTDQFLLRAITISDVPMVVEVHLKSFTGFFLTSLGPNFLNELYRAIITDASGIGFVFGHGHTIIGYVVGTEQLAGLYRKLLRQHWWRFGFASIRPLLNSPAILPRLLRSFSTSVRGTQIDKRGTLMSIAVLPSAQGTGVGQKLVQAFLKEAIHRGLQQVDLTTDHDHNEVANRFYQKLGFVCARSFTTPEGRTMNEYVIDLPHQAMEYKITARSQ